MAKRKRLSPPTFAAELSVETPAPRDARPGLPRASAPIADVAGDAAARAAFDEVADALQSAREEGRLIQSLPLAAIMTDHLVRDRLVMDEGEMDALKASLAARGQQTPIEVVTLPGGRYGLVSGWRRIEALRALGQDSVLALVRSPEGADGAYVAMIEENEIRAGLSYYERAHLASEAARIGIYPDVARAVAALFANASASKRSKILNYVSVHAALGPVLRFPTAIPERLGLALAQAIEHREGFAARLRDALRKTPAADAGTERGALERALKKGAAKPAKPEPQQVARGVFVEQGRRKVVLTGRGVDQALVDDLRAWLAART